MHTKFGKPNYHIQKPLDMKPGMTRALDFTPSTDQGQKYLDYLAKMKSDTESAKMSFPVAYEQISHLNNP